MYFCIFCDIMRDMKRWLSFLLAAVLLAYLLSSCSGHIIKKNTAPAVTLSPVGRLLTLAEWSADNDVQTLTFGADGTGTYAAAPFEWAEDSGDVTLRFFPGCAIGAERTAELTADGGALCLALGEAAYAPAFIDRSDKETEPAEPQPTAEELLGQQIAEYASGYIGWKYKYGGKSPETGFDCSGFVYYIYEQFGYRLERVANDQAKQGTEVEHDALLPGDLLAFYTSGKYVGHVGIYMGKGYYIHAMGSAYGVVLTPLEDSTRGYTARRIIGCEDLLIENVENAGADG